MKNRILNLLAPLALALAFLAPSAAEAQITNIYALNNAAHDITVGMARHNNAYRAWACYSSGGNATWVAIGNSSGLTSNVIIHGDQVSGNPNDDQIVMTRTSNQFVGVCAADSSSGSAWSPLQYNGYWLDLEGDGGEDTMLGGLGDTIVSGEDGSDQIFSYSCSTIFARGSGGGGSDGVNGRAGTCDNIRGDAGDDCLADASTSSTAFSTYDCGGQAGDDRYTLDGPSGTVGCPGVHFSAVCN